MCSGHNIVNKKRFLEYAILNDKDVHFLKKICVYALAATVIIHVLFKLKAPYEFLEAEWSAGEYLTFMAGVLTFAGTFILGVHTLKSANKYQEIANKLSEDNNRLQEVLAQNMLPILNVVSVETYPVVRKTQISEDIKIKKRTFLMGKHYKKDKSSIIIYLNSDVGDGGCNLRTMRLTLENISQVPIRHMAVPQIRIDGYNNFFKSTVCYNKMGQDDGKSVAISPEHSIVLDINIYYLNDVYDNVWDNNLGGLALTFFFENTSFAGKKFKQSISVSVANNNNWDAKFGDKDGWLT